MIYRVGDGNNPAYDYSSQLKSVGNAEGQEKFSLEHQKEQTSSSKKEEKGEDKKLHEKPGAEIKRSGVKLELSGAGKAEEETSEKTASRTAAADRGGSLWQTFLSIWQAVKDFIYRVWNDESPQIVSEDVTPEEAERYTEEYYALKGIKPEELKRRRAETVTPKGTEEAYKIEQAERDARIRKHLRSGNLEQVISLLTDDGKRSVAKNSTLLTYYDRSGKLRQMNASDRERILHGDRNVREL